MSPSVVFNVKDRSQNHTVTFGKGSNMQKMLENQRMNSSLLWTNKGLMNNYHKKKNSHPGMTSSINIKGMSTFERGHFYKFSHYFALWRIYLRTIIFETI